MMSDRTLAFLAMQGAAATLGVSVIVTACQGNPAHEVSSPPSPTLPDNSAKTATAASITIPSSAISPTPGSPPLVEAARILFFLYATEDRATSLYLTNIDGSGMTCVDEVYNGDYYSVGPISPDGKKVAYTRYADANAFDYKPLFSLYVMNIDEGDPKLVLDLAAKLGIDIWAVQPEGWSRDGKQIYIDVGTSDDSSGWINIHSLYAVSLDGSQITKSMQVRSLSFYSAFQLSPDGEQILTVKSTDPDGKPAAFIGAMDGSDFQQVPDTLQADEAFWSPDGKRIAITRPSEAGKLELIVEDIDGGHKVILDKDMRAAQVAWSPDGTRIAYDRHPDAITEQDTRGIWVASADGSAAMQLTHSPEMAYNYSTNFAWSPDGKWIAYDGPNDFGDFKIFVIRASGGKPRPVIDFIGKQSFAAWLP